MTIGNLMTWGGFVKTPAAPPIDRYHSGSSGYWEHKSHGHGSSKSGGKGGGGSGAALSALTLLAFLFLINVMQQSLQSNNATTPAPGTTALLLREEQQVSPSARAETDHKLKKTFRQNEKSISPIVERKGDKFDRDLKDRKYT